MKSQLIAIVAAVLVVGCGESQQSAPAPEATVMKFHEAAQAGDIEAVKQHIAAGTDVDAKTSYTKLTPLMNAARVGHKEIVELLIEKGADVNAKDESGSTPLNFAAVSGHKEIAELLIAEGAEMNAKDFENRTPLDWAIEENHTETADLLRKHGGKTSEELKAEGK